MTYLIYFLVSYFLIFLGVWIGLACPNSKMKIYFAMKSSVALKKALVWPRLVFNM